jgi:integrase
MEEAVRHVNSNATVERQQKEVLSKFEGMARGLKVGLAFDTLTDDFRRRLTVALMSIADGVKMLLAALNNPAVAERAQAANADPVELSVPERESATGKETLKVAKMIFKLARKDGLIADDPAEFVDPVKGKADGQSKRPFRLEELRALLDVADPEWKSMILFGLYTGQRLGDVARLTWANLDLPKSVVRLTTQKTHKLLIIPMAEPLARHVEGVRARMTRRLRSTQGRLGFWKLRAGRAACRTSSRTSWLRPDCAKNPRTPAKAWAEPQNRSWPPCRFIRFGIQPPSCTKRACRLTWLRP